MRFKTDGTVYTYSGVSPETARAITHGASVGSQFNALVRHGPKPVFRLADVKRLLDPEICPPEILDALRRPLGKSDKVQAHIFAAAVKPRKEWTRG